jgi:ABC-type amino acid transport substrate-binding protein
MTFLHVALVAVAADVPPTVRVLRVGVVDVPPLYMRTGDGRWSGFSVELWSAVAREMGSDYELREFADPQEMLEALDRKEIDVIPSMVVRERFEPLVDYSQSYVKSGLAIAVPVEKDSLQWVHIFEGLLSESILRAVAFMLVVSAAAGVLVWAFERRRNREMFGGDGTFEGIGHGIWWAMVTMTTVGYGDKAPRTIGGRVVALVWMVFSIIFIASFTANITTSLTLDRLKGKVHDLSDLKRVRVGSIAGTEGADFLTRQGVAVIPFANFSDGLDHVAERQIDAFVQDEHVLRFLAKQGFAGRVQILQGTYDEYFVSIALQERSPLRKPINRALLKYMKTEQWSELLNRYFG